MDELTPEAMARMIREALEKDGISQAEFARRVGCTQKHVSKVLTHQAHASQTTLDYWAFVLGRRFSVRLVKR
jgi:transcriptional regulator with XRE-family HTH domain